MMAFLNEEYIYLAVNDAYIKVFGLTRDNFVGYSIPKVFGTDFFNTVIKPNADKCLNGEIINYQDWFTFSNTERSYMDVFYYPYYSNTGTICGFIVNARNITKQRIAEEVSSRHFPPPARSYSVV